MFKIQFKKIIHHTKEQEYHSMNAKKQSTKMTQMF